MLWRYVCLGPLSIVIRSRNCYASLNVQCFNGSSCSAMTINMGCGAGNPFGYDFGFVYTANSSDSDAPCYSFGTNGPVVNLYDKLDPLRGVTLSYEAGDADSCIDNAPRRTHVSFICPSAVSGSVPFDIQINERSPCDLAINIQTAAACPFQCVLFDADTLTFLQCANQGRCGYDATLDAVRCECESGVVVDSIEAALCRSEGASDVPSIDSVMRQRGGGRALLESVLLFSKPYYFF